MTLMTKIRYFFWRIVVNFMEKRKLVVVSFRDEERSKIVDLINQSKKEVKMLLGTDEAFQIYMAVKNTSKIEGEIAEVGVYAGGSANLICKAKGDKMLHLFDTYEGLPKVGENDRKFFEGEFSASLEEVKYNLRNCKNVYFYKGLFPDSAVPVQDKKFSFVHLDVDIYKSTLDCLAFFYPRMVKAGIIISHDYFLDGGVRKAFEEFFENKPESIIPISQSQCLVVKV
jgi:O-methyltransferase